MNITATDQELRSTETNPSLEIEDEMFIDKLNTLKNILQSDLLACDAKWALFVAASQSYRYETELSPVPPQFIASETSTQINMNALISVINDTPRLHVVLQLLNDDQTKEINPAVIDLLFWVLALMADPYLRPLPIHKLTERLKKANITVPESFIPTQTFEVVHLQESPSHSFDNPHENAYGFYGNHLDVYYSLIQNGFTKYQSDTYFNGTLELSSSLMDAISKSPSGAAWGSSSCGSIISCVAICEYLDKPEFVIHKKTEDGLTDKIAIRNVDFVRIRYLLFYGNRTSDVDDNERLCKANWIKRNGKNLSMLLSIAVLITAVSATHRGGSIREICTKHICKVISFCHKAVKTMFSEFK